MAKGITTRHTSVIITVLNERQNIKKLVDALANQTLPPNEIIIVDGGSTDGTFAHLQSILSDYPRLKVFQKQGNRSLGRNFGVGKSSGQIIAFTDAGCVPQKNWLKKLSSPILSSQADVVSGYYTSDPKNIFQKSLIPYVFVMPDKAEKSEFFPSTRSMALTKSAWNKSGGFDTRLTHNEDYAYAHWLKKIGYNFYFAKEAQVVWQPRKNLSESAWMFLRFALGDIQAGIIRPQVKLLFIRFLIFLFLISLSLEVRFFILPTLVVFLFYLLWAVLKNYRYVRHPAAIFWLPVIQLTADVSVLFGSIIGFLSKQ